MAPPALHAARPEGRAGIVTFHHFPVTTASFRDDVLAGLAAPVKSIPPKYFYDARGSELFEAICELPEYYPTRTEMAIMREHAPAMARLAGRGCEIIEPGSGASTKTCIVIEQFDPSVYVPIDISESALRGAVDVLAARYPGLDIAAVCADFTRPLTLPQFRQSRGARRVLYFPGSTIGNFRPEAAVGLLALMRDLMGPDGILLIGVDTKKAKPVLDAAYDDAAGVTAAFNLNLLDRINRELGGDFVTEKFRHVAFYDPDQGRIEMHLRSVEAQTVTVGGHTFAFAKGETIHTEDSCKYAVPEFQALAGRAGFAPLEAWTDADAMFSVHALRAAG